MLIYLKNTSEEHSCVAPIPSILFYMLFIPFYTMTKKFVPDDFEIPSKLETGKFRLRMLTVDDVDKDYEAVMESTEHLKGFFGPKSKWPSSDMSKEEDLKDLRWHQEEFENRKSFAYTVVTLDESRCLGCVYIFPSRKKAFDADIFMWVRQSELTNGLDEALFSTVKKWIEEKWPFKNPSFPGREISWDKWTKAE